MKVFYSPFIKYLLKHRKAYAFLSILANVLIYYFGVLVFVLEQDYSEFSYPLEVPMDRILRAMKAGKDPAIQPINPFRYHLRIGNRKKCFGANSDEKEEIDLLFVVKSALGNRNRRDAVRSTWGDETQFEEVNIKRIFLLGNCSDPVLQNFIEKENEKHKDIVQGDFIDSYYNNTIKTTMGLRWIVHHCPTARIAFFADDDMFVSTRNVVSFAQKRKTQESQSTRKTEKRRSYERDGLLLNDSKNGADVMASDDNRLMTGAVHVTFPIRDQSSKWYVSLKQYPYSKYPPFINAGAYILSFPAVQDLYYASMFTEPFRFDDVYLGIVAKKCGITLTHNGDFHKSKVAYSDEAYAELMACHGYENPDELIEVWEKYSRALLGTKQINYLKE